MPLYEYRCQECGEVVEILQRIDEPPLQVCKHCGGAMTKLISAPAFQFKGTGWYVTDYARGGAARNERDKKAREGDSAAVTGAGTDAGASGAQESGDSSSKPTKSDTSPKSDSSGKAGSVGVA